MATEKGQSSNAPKSRADMPQGPRSTSGSGTAGGRQPSSVESGRAARQQQQPAARQQQPAARQQQPPPEQPEQPEQHDQGGDEYPFAPGEQGGEQGGGGDDLEQLGQSGDMGVMGSLGREILRQSVRYHVLAMVRILGLGRPEAGEVLTEVAGEFTGG